MTKLRDAIKLAVDLAEVHLQDSDVLGEIATKVYVTLNELLNEYEHVPLNYKEWTFSPLTGEKLIRLRDVPDVESGRLFDEWWSSVSREQMLEWGEQGLVQEKFDLWRSQRETKQ